MRAHSLLTTGLLAAAMAITPLAFQNTNLNVVGATAAHASEIKVIVNDEVVTSYDIARRSAFLKLQRRKGNLRQLAIDELTDDALKRSAIKRAGIRIPDNQVDAAFANFSKGNKLSAQQMGKILDQAGVTSKHFKEFIRLQIGWGQTVRMRSQRNSLMSEQDVVAKMLEQGGQKPTSTEYLLQQVIFVIPQDKRSSLLKRRRTEAANMRGRVSGCESTQQLATQIRDVTVRDLGRVLELSLPERWEKDVKGLKEGQTTRVKDTERGVEFLVVCRARAVSDDRVAQLEFSTQALDDAGGDLGKQYLDELRSSARIQKR
ncbi:peptidylprolyl isomerase [Ahrensia sp. 13_GOM-1096m]|uniref:SurA N-terminal domain-containing protein n=1 Tax=Ahrensia sp. 13_GOM-1096m TaxID=1380380 RepID=UPI00047A6604|nr:peptidylprolyl isomerase [Ahrensia sp. 13_GOM-1096m]